MAASMMLRCRQCCRLRKSVIAVTARNLNVTPQGFYVLLPEIPPDTPETNPIMRVDELPKFNEITPGKALKGTAKLALTLDMEVTKHVDRLQDPDVPKNFKTVFEPLEKLTVPLEYAMNTTKALYYMKHGEGINRSYNTLSNQVHRVTYEKLTNSQLHSAVKEVNADSLNLTEFQQRLVDVYRVEGFHLGASLSPKDFDHFNYNFKASLIEAERFLSRVTLSGNLFSHWIEDFGEVVDMEKEVVKLMSINKNNPSQGPWRVSLDQSVYHPFMEHCRNRSLRWKIWKAYVNRASNEHPEDQLLSNHNLIKDLRDYRNDYSNILGYENFSKMSLATKMAGSVENVLNLIENLKSEFADQAQEEITHLQEFAVYEGFQSNLEMYDVPYWRRRQREHLYGVDLNGLSPYFPLDKVLTGVFDSCRNLFGVYIREHTDEVNAWDSQVRFFQVYDILDDNLIGSFYLDAYLRDNKLSSTPLIQPLRARSDVLGTSPVSCMNLNCHQPVGSRPTLLSIRQAGQLYGAFGHLLQQLLTSVPYGELGGQAHIEKDALATCEMLMSKIFYHPHTLKQVSSHYQTGEPMTEEQVNNVIGASRHLSLYDMMHQLYLSAFDLELNVGGDYHWAETMDRIWPQYMPVSLNRDDNHPCALSSLFVYLPAAYYSQLWSEMLAADIFQAFDDAGMEHLDKTAAVGKRFRETFLELGGGVPAGEVFRRFRGRDPTLDALIKSYKETPSIPGTH